jgi:hypothetical protein
LTVPRRRLRIRYKVYTQGGVMDTAIVIHGKLAEKQFVSNEPMPDVEGLAELIVYPKPLSDREKTRTSIFELFGKAEHLRPAEDIDAQIREEREAWGER